jgi:hypothetical protein
MAIQPINNGDSGLAVRTKINGNFAELDAANDLDFVTLIAPTTLGDAHDGKVLSITAAGSYPLDSSATAKAYILAVADAAGVSIGGAALAPGEVFAALKWPSGWKRMNNAPGSGSPTPSLLVKSDDFSTDTGNMASDSRGWIYSAGSSGSMSVTGGSCSCTQSGSFYVNQATAYVDSGQADHEVDFTFNSTRTAIVMAARSTNQDCAYLRQSAADTLELTFINYTGNEIDDTFVANIAGWSDGNKGTLRVSAGAVRIYRQGALVSGPHALLAGLTGTTAGWRCHEAGPSTIDNVTVSKVSA